MRKQLMFFFLLLLFLPGILPAQPSFEKLDAKSQQAYKNCAAGFRSKTISYAAVENGVKSCNINFANMTIEDAIAIMMMLISNDAKKDLQDMLNNLEATRLKRNALREADQKMKEELDSLKKRNSFKNSADSINHSKLVSQKKASIAKQANLLKQADMDFQKAETKKITAEKRVQSISEAGRNSNIRHGRY